MNIVVDGEKVQAWYIQQRHLYPSPLETAECYLTWNVTKEIEVRMSSAEWQALFHIALKPLAII